MGFRLAPISVTLNDLERHDSLILHYFTKSDSLASRLRHSGCRQHIRSDAEYALPVIFWPKLTHTAVALSLCDS